MNTPNATKSTQVGASRQPMKSYRVACFFGMLLIAVALLRFFPWSGFDLFDLKKQLSVTQQRETDEARLHAEHERLAKLNAAKKQIGSLTDDAYARMMQSINEARSKVAKINKAQDERLPKLTAGISAYLQGYSNAMGLTWKMAVDKVRGTHKTQDYLEVAFRPAIQSLAKADAELLQVLTDCEYDLSMIKANLLASTAQVLDTADFKAVELGLEDNLRKLTASTVNQSVASSMKTAVATLEVAIEALLIKTTYDTISRLLAKAVAKEVGSVVIGIDGAAIPGVDIATTAIAVGGTVWTGWDVYWAVAELKKTGPAIHDGLAESVKQLNDKATVELNSLEQAAAILCNRG